MFSLLNIASIFYQFVDFVPKMDGNCITVR